MCTVSWLTEGGDYHVFFNRDEQRSRSQSVAPAIHLIEQTQTLMPIDPDGNGSWISSNEFGLTLCLLNFYQGIKPQGELTSRGLLLKALSAHQTVSAVDKQLHQGILNHYAPFSLLAFGYNESHQWVQKTWQWSGVELTIINLQSPFTSSSVEFEQVSQSRLSLARQQSTPMTVNDVINYHQSHQPSKGHLSVCMHRDDAKSVSFSHIHVTAQHINFSYKNASACSHEISDMSTLARKV